MTEDSGRMNALFKVSRVIQRDVVTVSGQTPVYAAMRIMIDQNTTSLPVAGEGMALEGMLSEQDMLALLYQSSVASMRVSDIMTTDVVSFDEDTDLIDVCEAMVKHQIRRVPIVRDGVLSGIVSRRDVIKFLLQLRQAH
jgi:CBS domain-containing protein